MGIKMGSSKLMVNVAKFAVENSGFSGHKKDGNTYMNSSSQTADKGFNVRDQRSYRDVLGKAKVSSDPDSTNVVGRFGGDGLGFKEKTVVVPNRLFAFKELVGSAVIGRSVDLETLVDLDKLFRIAKVEVARFQYLGGLYVIISFSDADAANKFLESRQVWGPWFSKLEVWGGQSLPMERVAWLSIHGIPLNLLEAEVLMQVGELFGKVLHVPKSLFEDSDLSVFKIGVLAGEAQRIREVVSLKWKDRTHRLKESEKLCL
ncbi:hypothetical protein HanXRQr2_Chr07g0305911 [Helianthus annuus]|uniref:DUF4283 domain-containing protein n=1 Tax=Helianthus annuus TaxID=4232 RepID=A0A9K3IMH3_HELAN|nr:hypothetical protein HanXRQr2_Chr07g0305911 [Helianthus annuus]